MDERWTPLPGYSKYEISTLGNVRHIPWRRDGVARNLKPFFNKGYAFVSFRLGKRHQKIPVHRYVLLAFVGRPDNAGFEACHLDGDRSNCCLQNLIWGTRETNQSHKLLHGTWPGGERNRLNKLRAHDIPTIRARIAGGELLKDIAAVYGVSRSAISMIKNGRTWSEHQAKLTQAVRLEVA